MMVNRLQLVLGSLISSFQNGFVPQRQVLDNILIAHEVLEHIRKRKKGKKSAFGLKLDMNKAYDRVNWEFLFGMLWTMGFSQTWVDWIKQWVTTVSFSVAVNGKWSATFRPLCGLRQGDPLSPCLFILVAQAFSDGLQEFASANVCRGISVSSRSPCISHLLFADDCFIFMEYLKEHAWCLKWVLDIYCQQAGQRINFNKSELFVSPNMSVEDRNTLSSIFGVKEVEKTGNLPWSIYRFFRKEMWYFWKNFFENSSKVEYVEGPFTFVCRTFNFGYGCIAFHP